MYFHYNGGPVAEQAHIDWNAAFIAASPAQLPGGINLGDGELGGRVLAPGVYQSAPGSYDITLDDLTLHGGPNDVWVFQMASTLTAGSGRQVLLTGGAQAKNITDSPVVVGPSTFVDSAAMDAETSR
jgi:hypothetical protein